MPRFLLVQQTMLNYKRTSTNTISKQSKISIVNVLGGVGILAWDKWLALLRINSICNPSLPWLNS